MSKLLFRIYIAGWSSRNKELVTTFKQICAETLQSNCVVEVVDVVRNAPEAEAKKILATPTIVREKPAPEKRIIGDFRNTEKGLQAFNFLTDDLNIKTKK